jgi:NAD+ synthase (glutamine-hydrolysing)
MPADPFLRVAVACPELRVADCRFNAERTLDLLREAEGQGVDVVVFPECGLTGYTCHDLFHQPALQRAAVAALETLLTAADMCFGGVAAVGLPLVVNGAVFNCAAVFRGGKPLGVVPKSFLPTYKEYYDARYFAPAKAATTDTVTVAGQTVPFGADVLFPCTNRDGLTLGVEICEDLWMPVPPSSLQALAGATVLLNLSASNETIGKAAYRRQLVSQQSARCLAAYAYASSGVGESTTDVVFGGHGLICENGTTLAESPRFVRDKGVLTVADVDLQRLDHERQTTSSFHAGEKPPRPFRAVSFGLNSGAKVPELIRYVDPHPFVPSDPATLAERCDEIFHTQVAGLAGRLSAIGKPAVSIGVSGGLDSTLALLVACKTFDALGEPRSKIKALTMPGFGTTQRTLANARALMAALGVSAREVDIRPATFDQLKAIGHAPFGIPLANETVESFGTKLRTLPKDKCNDLVFENTQARVRTSLLMNTGFVVGTGDLSELALGWCTYNADQISMYNPNVSIPKTLVKFLVRHTAETEFAGDVRTTLLDVVDTVISPELLPAGADGSVQPTEAVIGPYELHDFFLYHVVRFGTPPETVLFLAKHAVFDKPYPADEVRHWLKVFLTRFFANQFKRSCLPDGPKVGSVSLSPRGDWRMPSDASARAWLDCLS